MTQGKCFKCGEPGHFAAGCPEVKFAEELGTDASGKPPWCGQCDKRTRTLFDPGADQVTRCPRCNPSRELPEQFRICGCGGVVYRWDRLECGSHQPVGVHLPPASTASCSAGTAGTGCRPG